MRKKRQAEKKSWGTIVAEKGRAKANTFSDDKREQLMKKAMQLIYGETADDGAASHRRGH